MRDSTGERASTLSLTKKNIEKHGHLGFRLNSRITRRELKVKETNEIQNKFFFSFSRVNFNKVKGVGYLES